MRRTLLPFALAATASVATGQAPYGQPEQPADKKSVIQDNSFLVEEAYNQEPGVVQHINLFQRNWRSGEWSASFTQEYPVPGNEHQLSYSVLYQRVDVSSGTAEGLGDLALNYRYQLVGNGKAKFAIAPRVTVLLPTGNDRRGLGSGSTGVQVSLPASTVLSGKWVAHWNAGATFVPSARDERGKKADTFSYNFGASAIWLGRGLNVMLETVWVNVESVVAAGKTDRTRTFLVSPGVRWAYDLPAGLQVVPGIAFPIGVGPSRGNRSLLLYLSFEHPFWNATR